MTAWRRRAAAKPRKGDRPGPVARRRGPRVHRRRGRRILHAFPVAGLAWILLGCGGGISPSSTQGTRATPPTAPAPTPPPTPEPEAPAYCGGLEIETTHEGVRREEFESLGASFVVRGAGAETSVDVVSPYRHGGRYPPPSWAFVEAFAFRRTGDGIERMLTVEWIGALELAVRAPDCPALPVVCDADECVVDPESEVSGAAAP